VTIRQSQALWELCRQGFPLSADEAAACWETGKTFLPDWSAKVSRSLEQLIDCCNGEVEDHAERH
jgi:hypothetical protein